MTNDYEITYLVNPALDEAAKYKVDETIDAAITDRQGAISYSLPTDAPSSRRRLHYPIGDKKVTWIRCVQAQLDADRVEELRQLIRKTDGVNRVTILRTTRREEVPASIFEQSESSSPQENKAPTTTPKTPAKEVTKEVTMKEVEAKIEKALDEEVK